MHIDKEYIIRIRRELHQIPEIGYDLPKTLAVVRRELDNIGIPYTEQYGTSSIVATLNEGVGNKTIALRADMDALPVVEQNDLPFASTHPGKMHACGHDCHTAMLLGTAKALKEMEKEITCCVKFVFQASEEGPSGALRICNDGFMDTVDMILACHIAADLPIGTIQTNKTCHSAGSHGFRIHLYGKNAHVSRPQLGVDAIAMASRVFSDIQIMRARELNPFDPVVIGIGEIHGGNANNVICDHVMMHGTIRTLSDQLDQHIYKRIEQIAQSVAADMGGRAEVETSKYNPAVCNDPDLTDRLIAAAARVIGQENVFERPLTMGAEDFSHYMKHKPGMMFDMGILSPGAEFIPLHNGKLMIDESGLDVTPRIFIDFILNEMN